MNKFIVLIAAHKDNPGINKVLIHRKPQTMDESEYKQLYINQGWIVHVVYTVDAINLST